MLLEKMKTGVGKYVMMVLAVLLIASFAIWGVEDLANVGSGPREVASVGGTAVTQQEFREQYRREMNRIRERIGNIDPEQARNLGLADATLNGIVSRRLLALQAQDMGLLVSDAQVVEHIHREPAFRNALGQFDRAVFQNTLANSGLSEAEYVRSVRHDLQQEYLGGAISTGLSAPRPLADAVFAYRNERRSAEVVHIPRGAVSEIPAPSDEEIAEYYEKNGDPFMAPEYRTLTLLYLNPEAIAREMTPAPERVREEYEYRLDSLSIPERRHVQQILLRDEETADRAHALLSEGRSFAAVAKEVDGKSDEEIDLGLVAEGDLLPDLGTAVFALETDGFTAPLRSPLGWHILRVSEIQPGREPSLAEVEKEIVADLAREMAVDDLVKRANGIEDALAGGAGIEEAASQAGLQTRTVGPLDAARNLQTGTPVDGLPPEGDFIETAFSTAQGRTSGLIETDDGGYFMLRVDEVTPPAKRPLAEVREAVVSAWQRDRLDAAARETAERVFEEAKGGRPLLEIAEENGLTVRTGAAVTRFASGSETVVPQALLSEIFEADRGGVVMGQTSDGFAVARVTEIVNPETDTESGDYARLLDTVASAISNDLIQEYTRALRSEYSVSVNPAALDAFYGQQ